jgi:hypothetical protein
MMYRQELSVVKRGILGCLDRNEMLYGEKLIVVQKGIECCIQWN